MLRSNQERELMFLDEVIKIEAERTNVLSQFFRGFFEGKKHARFIVQQGSPNKELDPQECFAAASAAAYQDGKSCRTKWQWELPSKQRLR